MLKRTKVVKQDWTLDIALASLMIRLCPVDVKIDLHKDAGKLSRFVLAVDHLKMYAEMHIASTDGLPRDSQGQLTDAARKSFIKKLASSKSRK